MGSIDQIELSDHSFLKSFASSPMVGKEFYLNDTQPKPHQHNFSRYSDSDSLAHLSRSSATESETDIHLEQGFYLYLITGLHSTPFKYVKREIAKLSEILSDIARKREDP